MPDSLNKKLERYERWRQLSPELIARLPEQHRNRVLAAMRTLGKHDFAVARKAELEAARSKRLSPTEETVMTIVVVLVGALTFSLVPYMLSEKAGRSNALSMSVAFVGGGAASFFAKANAVKYLTGKTLKRRVQQSRNTIRNQEMEDN